MAIIPSDTYPGQVDESDLVSYPLGAAQNVVVEGDGIGYPLEKTWVNDLLGWQQALLARAGITASGDPDTAVDSQYSEAIEWIAASANATFDPVHPLFGAVGEIVTESEDDTAELQACFDAAYAAIGGGNVTVDLGGRSYRVTGALTCYPHVNVKHGKIVMYHASANFLVWGTAATQRTATVWEDVDFGIAEANSGIIINNPSAVVDVVFRNCHFNASGFCSGRLFFSPAASDFSFEKCTGKVPLNNAGFRSDLGKLDIVGGKYTTPTTYADVVVQGTGGVHNLDRVEFDLSGTTGGNATAVQAAGQIANVDQCLFRGGDFGNTAIGWNSGATLNASGNSFVEIGRYDAVGPLAAGYTVELSPHFENPISGTTVTISATYESTAISSINATAPTITLDDPLFLGQELEVIVYNDHATDPWATTVGFTGNVFYTETGLENLANNELASIRFRAVTVAGGPHWVQIGAAAQHFLAS